MQRILRRHRIRSIESYQEGAKAARLKDAKSARLKVLRKQYPETMLAFQKASTAKGEAEWRRFIKEALESYLVDVSRLLGKPPEKIDDPELIKRVAKYSARGVRM